MSQDRINDIRSNLENRAIASAFDDDLRYLLTLLEERDEKLATNRMAWEKKKTDLYEEIRTLETSLKEAQAESESRHQLLSDKLIQYHPAVLELKKELARLREGLDKVEASLQNKQMIWNMPNEKPSYLAFNEEFDLIEQALSPKSHGGAA